MKRWIFTILLFLLLVSGGAIVNVAVAWGCALASGRDDVQWFAHSWFEGSVGNERPIPSNVWRVHRSRGTIFD